MAKYLVKVSYTAQGVQGLLNDGGSKRRAVATKAIEGLGGSVEAYYYAFGETDVYVIIDMPDYASVSAASLAVGASGAAAVTTTVLIEPEEIDEATNKVVNYSPPGQ